jgi:hypothetical protein
MSVLQGDVGDVLAEADTSGTRLSLCVLTDPDADETIRYVGDRIRRYLGSRGVRAVDIEDVCQEALARAIQHHVPYATPDALLAWCLRVARNLHVDDIRRTERHRLLAVVEDRLGDVEEDALGALRVQAVLDAFAELSEQDQAILASRTTPRDRRESNRMAVQRFRARSRLRNILGGALAACWVSVRKLPRLGAGSALTVVAAAMIVTVIGSDLHRAVDPALPAAPTVLQERTESAVVPAVTGAAAGRPGSPTEAQGRPQRIVATHDRVVVEPEGVPQGVYVETRPRTPDDHLVCAHKVPLIGDLCTPD